MQQLPLHRNIERRLIDRGSDTPISHVGYGSVNQATNSGPVEGNPVAHLDFFLGFLPIVVWSQGVHGLFLFQFSVALVGRTHSYQTSMGWSPIITRTYPRRSGSDITLTRVPSGTGLMRSSVISQADTAQPSNSLLRTAQEPFNVLPIL